MSTNTSIGAAAAASAAERSQRSVFVGNIPYEATEEELKDLFSQVGPVVGFRLVFDRETGKPKGYGFCEYLDQETAMSALRNLNQFEFHGRNLRVDTAAGDRSKEELRQLQMTFGGPAEESPYGAPVEPPKAPEAISRAVASLPPEQMFELMKQMKLCIQNNPNEARNMLLQNPQLAYALLQAQVVMRIVDPQVAMTMLHRETAPNPMMNIAPPMGMPQMPPLMPPVPPTSYAGSMPPSMISPPNMGGGSTLGDMDYRMIQSGMPPMFSGGQSMNLGGSVGGGFNLPPPVPPMPPMTRSSAMGGGGGGSSLPSLSGLGMLRGGGADEQERAALIMQVLALTDDQIALLPSEQKQSVLILRDQLRNSQQ